MVEGEQFFRTGFLSECDTRRPVLVLDCAYEKEKETRNKAHKIEENRRSKGKVNEEAGQKVRNKERNAREEVR